ncbi:MAG TPA: hypothetical protein DC049_13455 [Spirochaetia bacterium]|nr:hypothetical protein [Spirochaetia bacterium]
MLSIFSFSCSLYYNLRAEKNTILATMPDLVLAKKHIQDLQIIKQRLIDTLVPGYDECIKTISEEVKMQLRSVNRPAAGKKYPVRSVMIR